VDRDIDRLPCRIGPGDIVVLDALDLDRVTADALVDAGVAGVVNASPSISGPLSRIPRPELLVANHIALIDNAWSEVFGRSRTEPRSTSRDSAVYSGDRRIGSSNAPTREIADLMHDAKTGLVRASEAIRGQHHRVHPQRVRC
jgi:uncharacterized membrane-anchored protein